MFTKFKNWKLLLLIPCLLLILPLLPQSPLRQASSLVAKGRYYQALNILEGAEEKYGTTLEYQWLILELYYQLGLVSESVHWLPAESLGRRSLKLVRKIAASLTEDGDWYPLSQVLGWLYAQGEPCHEQYKMAILQTGAYPSPIPLGNEEARLLEWLHQAERTYWTNRRGLRLALGLGYDESFLTAYQALAPETDYFRTNQDYFGPELQKLIQQTILELDATALTVRLQQGHPLPPDLAPELIERVMALPQFLIHSPLLPWAELYQAYPNNPILASLAAGHLGLAEPQAVAEILAPYPREDFTRPRWRLEVEQEIKVLPSQVSLSPGGKWLGIRSIEGITLHRLTDGYSRLIPGTFAGFNWAPQGEALVLMSRKGPEVEVFLMGNPRARPRKFAQGPFTEAFWWDRKHVALDRQGAGLQLMNMKGRVVRDISSWELRVFEQLSTIHPKSPDFGPGTSSIPLGDKWLGIRNLDNRQRLIVYHGEFGFGHVDTAALNFTVGHLLYSQETGQLITWTSAPLQICRLVPIN